MSDRDNDLDDDFDSDDDYGDDEAETLPCPECGAEVYEDAEQCPRCGAYITPHTHALAGWPWVLVALGLCGVVAVVGFLLFGAP